MELNRNRLNENKTTRIPIFFFFFFLFILLLLCSTSSTTSRSSAGPDSRRCPSAKAAAHTDLHQLQLAAHGRRAAPPDAAEVEGDHDEEITELRLARRGLGGPGSSPPRCASKCGKCTPCTAVHVPVPPGTPVTAEYYPEAWRCKCGNKLYMP